MNCLEPSFPRTLNLCLKHSASNRRPLPQVAFASNSGPLPQSLILPPPRTPTEAMSSTSWVAGLHFIGLADKQASIQEISDSFSALVKEKLKNIDIYFRAILVNQEEPDAEPVDGDKGFHQEVKGETQYILSGIIRTDGYVKECSQESYWKTIISSHFEVYGFTMVHSFKFYNALGTGSATVQNLEKIQDSLEKSDVAEMRVQAIGTRIRF